MIDKCHCGGNCSLHMHLDGVHCECGGKLNEQTIMGRVISRLNELESLVSQHEDQIRQLRADLKRAKLNLHAWTGGV